MTADYSWPHGAVATRNITSFDGGSRAKVSVQQPDRYGFFKASQQTACAIVQGGGLSFAAASFGPGTTTIDLRAFDRILDFDSVEGVVEVEAGVTLGILFHFLQKQGFYLPVHPGYPGISVGGCIAADVHGKNAARDGTFIKQVQSIRLFHPSHGIVEVSPDVENDLFRATCGGFGLTGIIVAARLKAARLPGCAVHAALHFVSNLPEAIDTLTRVLPESDFAYGWHDLNFSDARFGRGYIAAARFVDADVRGPDSFKERKMTSDRRQVLQFPLLNRFTSRAMCIAYRHAMSFGTPKPANIFKAMFPWYGKESYFTLFGRAGFHESQVIVPRDSFIDYVEALRDAVARTGAVICFSALKFFSGANDLTRFDGTGVSLAVHLPRSTVSARFLDAVDRATVELGGRPNAIKDSRLPRVVFEATYPECDRFRRIIDGWDSKRIFRSTLTTRLGL